MRLLSTIWLKDYIYKNNTFVHATQLENVGIPIDIGTSIVDCIYRTIV